MHHALTFECLFHFSDKALAYLHCSSLFLCRASPWLKQAKSSLCLPSFNWFLLHTCCLLNLKQGSFSPSFVDGILMTLSSCGHLQPISTLKGVLSDPGLYKQGQYTAAVSMSFIMSTLCEVNLLEYFNRFIMSRQLL